MIGFLLSRYVILRIIKLMVCYIKVPISKEWYLKIQKIKVCYFEIQMVR